MSRFHVGLLRFFVAACAFAFLTLAFLVWPIPERTAADDEFDAVRPADGYVRTHVVRAGESLWSIAAAELHDGTRWRALATHNDLRPPYRISVGQVLRLP